MKITDELLIAYAEGKADARTRAAVEAAMAQDRALRARVESLKRRRPGRKETLVAPLDEAASGHLRTSARGESASARTAAKPAEIVDLASVRALKAAPKTRTPPRRAWLQWGILAACLAVGVILARGLGSIGTAPLIGDRQGTLMAQGALAQALDRQIAGSPAPPDQAVKIGVSFHAFGKIYCRTFQVLRGDGLAGLACRAPAGWQVRVAAAEPAQTGAPVNSRTAVSAAVDAMIDGPPLDAKAEAAARAKGWRE